MSKNKEAYEAVLAAAETPLHGPNPLILYGRNNKKRAELLSLAAEAAAESYSSEMTEYVDSADLKNNYTQALLRGGGEHIEGVEKRLRSALVVIVDNVQLLQPSKNVADLAFHLFWELSEDKHQLILGLNSAPQFTHFPKAYIFFLTQGTVLEID